MLSAEGAIAILDYIFIILKKKQSESGTGSGTRGRVMEEKKSKRRLTMIEVKPCPFCGGKAELKIIWMDLKEEK